MRVDCGIASIPPFWVDVSLSSKNIWFGTKMTRTEPNDKAELRKILKPLYLPPGEYLSSKKYSRFLWSVIILIR